MAKATEVQSTRGERLQVHPHCLMFFVDETGHETFADPKNPVFGMGGCALLAASIDPMLRAPWRAMKAQHFGGADVALHAADLRPTSEQIEALNAFFRNQAFGRFAVTMTASAALNGHEPIRVMPDALRRRYEELVGRCRPVPVEVAFIHEGSTRADPLLEKYFGETIVTIEGKRIPTHQS